MTRVHNFSAGPAALPESVLAEAQAEFLDYASSGMSILEMSHRSATYREVIDDADATLRRILDIPANYRILFLQGGATLQFAGVPLNLMRRRRAGYLLTGNFAKKAWEEASRYGDARVLASSEDTGFDRIPDLADAEARIAEEDLDYVHICQNNTIFGTMFTELPACGDTPLVADVSSCFLSFPLDIERYGLIYAGAQKNAGPAGVTVVIARDDLIADGPALDDICPTYMGYRLQADKGSMYNTPNTFGIYLCGKVFRWVEGMGGVEAMESVNRVKADLLYETIDESRLFRGTAQPGSRSIANVTFRTDDPALDAAFIAGARERGIEGLKGHRITGGMRASIYNAVPLEAVEALASFMREFEEGVCAGARGGRSS
ncbi:MAG: 3-phosphoserine/phosphohydroxythreonine transaminase [Collinsella sp.]|nr:3-phosphoserine/phosphohydroxythreonine transaminase [Collinsella sp.]